MNLKAERLNRGLTVRQVAAEVGIARGTLKKAEDTGQCPLPPQAKAIADFYGVKVTDIWPLEEMAA